MSKARILIVEDEVIVARDIHLQLLELGYEVVGQVTRGEQAIELAGSLRPDLVLMDIQLAGEMDGIDAAQVIHRQMGIPVVFLTAFAADDTIRRAKLTEPYGYILKPFSERELRTVLEMALYKHQADAALKASAQHSQAILDNIVDGVITISPDGIVQSFNRAASNIFGYAPEEVIGRNVSMLMPDTERALHDGYLAHQRGTGEARGIGLGRLRELQGRRKDGFLFPITLSVARLTGSGQNAFIGLVRDITQLRADEEEIHRLAHHDLLTGLPNRRMLGTRLNQGAPTPLRAGQQAALILLDLDHFKQLNDTMGHSLGDVLIEQAARRLRNCVRAEDTVARLGGDEFVVLLDTMVDDPVEAAVRAGEMAATIQAALGAPYNLLGHSYRSSASLGIVVFQDGHECADDLLKKADLAMYQAKSAGRGTARFFDDAMQSVVTARAALESDLRLGLDRGEFLLHYQIQVDCDGMVIGVEALVRWNHPRLGMVPPGQFIPMAEETGTILPLGQWVLETACAELAGWAGRAETACWTMAVNVSASQFAQRDFVDSVVLALQKTGANPGLLKLELTESMVANDLDGITGKMNQLKARGVTFSLDDFGTGYSSLSYLKRLPLHQLKIDQSFVRELLSDPNDAAIAGTVVALGHSLGLKVIAEGVETVGQRDFLEHLGCDAFQGYLFGRPVPAAALPAGRSTDSRIEVKGQIGRVAVARAVDVPQCPA